MDLLNMGYINSLPQPFMARLLGGDWWEVESIDVETGLTRILVCGLLQVVHFGDITAFRDMDGTEHYPESFYLDAQSA